MSEFEDPFNTTTEEFALGVGETFSISWNPLDMTEGLVPVSDVTISIAMVRLIATNTMHYISNEISDNFCYFMHKYY